MYKKIVVAVDGSDVSKTAFKHALALAKTTGGSLTAVHVVPPLDVTDIESFRPDMVIEGFKKDGEKILSEAKNTAAGEGVGAETRLEEGIPYDKICEVADEVDADLIVMGSHGRTGIGKVFIGSITERVIGKVNCRPVLIVK